MQPAGAETALPTILNIHGGPHAGWGAHFNFDNLMFSGAGYGVLLVNHRASTGYGDDFATAIKGDWGNLDYADLMAGVDHAIEEGLADPDRLGVFGISGGGNLTGWIIGQTDRFKAACPENPVFNWFSMYGTSDVGADFSARELGGTPYEVEDVYRRSSPITYAHRCTTPTLFLQHENDYRCPPSRRSSSSRCSASNGCRRRCCASRTRRTADPRDGPIGHRRAQNDALLDWMNRYVLDTAVESEEEHAATCRYKSVTGFRSHIPTFVRTEWRGFCKLDLRGRRFRSIVRPSKGLPMQMQHANIETLGSAAAYAATGASCRRSRSACCGPTITRPSPGVAPARRIAA